MSASKNLIQASAGVGGGDFYPYTVDYSARFNDNDSAYLTRTLGAGDTKKWTWSGWVKISEDIINSKSLFSCNSSRPNGFYINYGFAGTYPSIALDIYFNGTRNIRYADISVRDVSAWYHIVVALDTTQATDSDRLKLYINGSDVPLPNTNGGGWPPLNSDGDFNSAIVHSISRRESVPDDYFDGYLSQVCFIDGQQLDPTSFGENKNGVWVPKNVSGLAFGTNGFYLDFSNSAALGTDVSGNGNNFTSSGLTSSDQVIDTPTNNFPTWNPLLSGLPSGTPTLSDGNLTALTTGAGSGHAYATMAIPESGDWYWEVTWDTGTYWLAGIAEIDRSTVYIPLAKSVMYHSNGFFYQDATTHTGYTAASTGDVVGIRANVDTGTVSFYLNNTLLDTFTYDVKGMFPQTGDASGTAGVNTISATANFGQSSFTYTPPGTSVALCTANFPEPTIRPNTDTTSDENFDTALYTGNGGTTTVSSLNFQPDFTWLKSRTYARYHALADVLRGSTKILSSNSTGAEDTVDSGNGVVWNSTGFEVDASSDWNSLNESGADIVAWNWKANSSGVSNTDGSITSTVSANQDAGFSIVTYTGNGTTGSTVGHGLDAIPDFIIVKSRSRANTSWPVWSTQLSGNTYVIDLQTTDAERVPTDAFWTPQNNTNSVFGLGFNTVTNYSGETFVAYCFAEVEGFSSFGSYTGNGSADGSFIYTGFRPAFVIVKQTNTARDWELFDTERNAYNLSNKILEPNNTDAEVTAATAVMDILSNGFKPRGVGGSINASGGTYIYMAFAENPFKYSNAR